MCKKRVKILCIKYYFYICRNIKTKNMEKEYEEVLDIIMEIIKLRVKNGEKFDTILNMLSQGREFVCANKALFVLSLAQEQMLSNLLINHKKYDN